MMRRLSLLLMLLLALHACAATPQLERWSNGFRLLVAPTTSSQVVSVELLIDYSALDESAATQGVRQVLLSSMLQGSRNVDGTTIRRRLTMVGGTLEGRIHQDMLEFTVSVPASALATGLSALAEVVCRPQLADNDVQLAIMQSQRQLMATPVGALDTASRLSYQLLYAGHPFAARGIGTPTTLAHLTPEMVRSAYHSYVLPNAAVMAVVGRCDPEAVRGQVQAQFGLWNDRPRVARPTADPPALAKSQLELREAPVKSTCVMLTFPACGVTHKDYLAMRLIDVLLGGGTGSRLFQHIREEQHLAYEAATDFPGQASSSHFTLYALTDSSLMEETKAALVAELSRMQVTPVADSELQRARAYLKGHYLLSHQYSAQYAFDLAWYELTGLGSGYDSLLPASIDAITPQEVQRVARTYFTRYYLVVVIPQTTGVPESATGSLSRFTTRVQAR